MLRCCGEVLKCKICYYFVPRNTTWNVPQHGHYRKDLESAGVAELRCLICFSFLVVRGTFAGGCCSGP